MDQFKITTVITTEERQQLKVEMTKILEEYSKEEIEKALRQLNKATVTL